MPGNRNRPRVEPSDPTFPGRNFRWERCDDCETDERLNLLGQPIFLKAIGVLKTNGCETCGGTGHTNRGIIGVDPYEIPKR